MRCGFINRKRRYAETEKLLSEYGIDVDPRSIVKNLSVAQMQMVELARAISYQAKLIIMDEPTSALSASEIERLYKIVRMLSAKGVSIIFISHKLQEIYDICSRVTVMRDGHYITCKPCKELTIDELVNLIAGREIQNLYPQKTSAIGEEVLRVEHLEDRAGRFHDISFHAGAGEIVGFCGLVGAGRTEIMRTLFGVDRLASGKISVHGEEIKINSPEDAIQNGLGMLTEDRLRLGSIRQLSVQDNITAASLDKISDSLFINRKKEIEAVRKTIQELEIKTASGNQAMALLSGGNQQKVLIGRWLLTDPKILILDEPTRGIDVGSKSEIHSLIVKLAQMGVVILLVSSELPELLGLSDRIYVIRNGRNAGEFSAKDTNQEELMRSAFGTETGVRA